MKHKTFFEKHEKRFRYAFLLALYIILAVSIGLIPIGMVVPVLSISIGSVIILRQVIYKKN